jgi:hypothetical protein
MNNARPLRDAVERAEKGKDLFANRSDAMPTMTVQEAQAKLPD